MFLRVSFRRTEQTGNCAARSKRINAQTLHVLKHISARSVCRRLTATRSANPEPLHRITKRRTSIIKMVERAAGKDTSDKWICQTPSTVKAQ